MNSKNVVVGAMILLILVLAGYMYYMHSLKVDDLLNRPHDSLVHFSQMVQNSQNIVIVEDISGTVDPYRRNIMQCGVDYAISIGALNKSVDVYVLENGTCYTMDENGPKEMGEGPCIREIESKNAPIIYIVKGENKTGDTYRGLLYVTIKANYTRGECSIMPKPISEIN